MRNINKLSSFELNENNTVNVAQPIERLGITHSAFQAGSVHQYHLSQKKTWGKRRSELLKSGLDLSTEHRTC